MRATSTPGACGRSGGCRARSGCAASSGGVGRGRTRRSARRRRADWAELSLIAAWRSSIEGAAGRFGDAEREAERALVLQRRCDYAFASIVAQPVLAIVRAMRGNLDGARRGLASWREAAPSRWIDQLDAGLRVGG